MNLTEILKLEEYEIINFSEIIERKDFYLEPVDQQHYLVVFDSAETIKNWVNDQKEFPIGEFLVTVPDSTDPPNPAPESATTQ